MNLIYLISTNVCIQKTQNTHSLLKTCLLPQSSVQYGPVFLCQFPQNFCYSIIIFGICPEFSATKCYFQPDFFRKQDLYFQVRTNKQGHLLFAVATSAAAFNVFFVVSEDQLKQEERSLNTYKARNFFCPLLSPFKSMTIIKHTKKSGFGLGFL